MLFLIMVGLFTHLEYVVFRPSLSPSFVSTVFHLSLATFYLLSKGPLVLPNKLDSFKYRYNAGRLEALHVHAHIESLSPIESSNR